MDMLTYMHDDMIEAAREYMTEPEIRELETEFRNRRILSQIGGELVKMFMATRRDEIEYIREKICKKNRIGG